MNAFRGVGCSIALIVTMFITGCSSPKNDAVYAELPGASGAPETSSTTASAEVAEVAVVEVTDAPPSETNPAEVAAPAEQTELIVTPDDTLTGGIVSVNDVGRFVVLTFPLGRMPAEGSTLFVYRQGLKVAELKVTGPQKDDHTVADITTGECRANDEVRDR